MNDTTTWIFTCPRCGELIKAPKFFLEQSAADQLKHHITLTLQRHIAQYHPDVYQMLLQLLGQFAGALITKYFDTLDGAAIVTRADLLDACIKALTEPWEVSKVIPPPGPALEK